VSRAQQQGVALITALVLVALATVVAVSIGFNSEMSVRRTVATFSVEQGLQLGYGAEALAAYALREDKNADDSAVDAWNQHYGPVEVAPEVSLEAQVSDEQAKFNVNSLLLADGTPDPDAGLVFSATRGRWRRRQSVPLTNPTQSHRQFVDYHCFRADAAAQVWSRALSQAFAAYHGATTHRADYQCVPGRRLCAGCSERAEHPESGQSRIQSDDGRCAGAGARTWLLSQAFSSGLG
jgi:Type II secretion system (T2SS), protein K